jgi:hypothetical protein
MLDNPVQLRPHALVLFKDFPTEQLLNTSIAALDNSHVADANKHKPNLEQPGAYHGFTPYETETISTHK